MVLDSIIYSSDFIATHSFLEATETRHVERVAPGAGVLGDSTDTAVVSAIGQVPGLSVTTTGRGRIIVGCSALRSGLVAPTDSLTFRLLFYNTSSIIVGTSAEASSFMTGIQDLITNDSGRYYCTLTVFANDVGASSVGVYVTGLPLGAANTTISLYAV